MISAALALLLSTSDAGFEPVILDVHHGEVFLSQQNDAGYSDAPLKIGSSVCMDEATAEWVAGNKARSRGRASVGPAIDTQTLFWISAIMFAIGILGGGILVAVFK